MKNTSRGLLLILCVTVVSSYIVDESFASDDITHIAIEFSESCVLLQSLGDADTCSTPQYLQKMFPEAKLKPSFQKLFDNAKDNKETQVQKNDILLNHKLSCVQKDYCEVFSIDETKKNKLVFWYDPDQKIRGYYDHVITITPNILHANIDPYKNVISSTETTRIIEMEIDQLYFESCSEIIYKPDYIWLEMGNIIGYLVNDCSSPKLLGSLYIPYAIELEKHDLDVTTSPNWQYLKQQEELLPKYKQYQIGKD